MYIQKRAANPRTFAQRTDELKGKVAAKLCGKAHPDVEECDCELCTGSLNTKKRSDEKKKKIETGEETIGDTGEGKEDDELEPEDKLAFDIRNSPVFLEYQKYSNPITTPSDKAHLPFLDFERTQEWIYPALPSLMDHKERTKVAVKWKTGEWPGARSYEL
jgi:hypothetical protein